MSYRVAAIDIHKKVLMVVVATAAEQVEDAAGEALEFECRRFGAGTNERMHLVSWLRERGVTEVVMESTAQYWKPVWLDLEPHFGKLHLAQAQSNNPDEEQTSTGPRPGAVAEPSRSLIGRSADQVVQRD